MKKLLLVLFIIALAVSPLVVFTLVTQGKSEGEGEGKIAFASDRDGEDAEIYIMNADGSNQTRLTNNSAGDLWPCFSPDGTEIAFTSGRDGDLEIYIMNADGSNQTSITNNPAGDIRPSWGP